MHFLMTTEADSAKKLEKLGFQLISKTETGWIFLNNERLTFSNVEKVIHTNKMMF